MTGEKGDAPSHRPAHAPPPYAPAPYAAPPGSPAGPGERQRAPHAVVWQRAGARHRPSVEDRAVAVLAGRQGSGVLLDSRHVLTCAHVVAGPGPVRVAVPGGNGPVPCDVLWICRDEATDVALLRACEDLLDREREARLPRFRWGTVATRRPLPGCQAVGFPRVQRYGAGELECEQLTGTLKPASGRLRGRYVLDGDHTPPEPAAGGGSPWAGMSGAPLFAGPVLIGLVAADPGGWRHGRVEAVPVASFADTMSHQLGLSSPSFVPSFGAFGIETLTEAHPEDVDFEERYATVLRAAYGKTEIIGLDELSQNEASWDLETTYLSLKAEPARQHDPLPDGVEDAKAVTSPSRPQHVDKLLAFHQRSVVRGEAGAGKTTLVWWLASHTACATHSGELAALNGLIPFVVPMRSLVGRGSELPSVPQFPSLAELPSAAKLPIGEAPRGWVERVLSAGRGFLLVDGLDELPQEYRSDARAWLLSLLRAYPHTRCLVTVRPLAVEYDWLAAEEFKELRLLPMSDKDIQAYVRMWHQAARGECARLPDSHRTAVGRADLDALEEDLAREFARNAALRDLARTPLLCAVVCALHRRRRGLLPNTRWELYRAALGMLLGGRDASRRIGAPEGVSMSVEEHQQVLQRIAAWLVRNGRAELGREAAAHQVAAAAAAMPQVRRQGSADQILIHLLNRTGLLRERAPDVIEFIHRTFQDFLAAKEFRDSDSLEELIRNAGNEQWRDVVRLAVGHFGRREVEQLVTGLIRAGDCRSQRAERWPLHILAADCAEHAVALDPEIREAAWARVKCLLPPDDESEARDLVALGPQVLPLLPDAEAMTAKQAFASVIMAYAAGGTDALLALRRLARHGARHVRVAIARQWSNHPAGVFAATVLAHMRLDDLYLEIWQPEEADQLPGLGPIGSLYMVLDSDDRTLRALDRLRGRTGLALLGLELKSLRSLASLAPLPGIATVSITVHDASGVEQIARVFPDATDLSIQPMCDTMALDLRPLANLATLTVRVHGPLGVKIEILGRAELGGRLKVHVRA
ncbi:NACHT domain-containing protein [Streptomyces sp. URMC 123]|uniref:NACHT domain-containing protein n=1 Tax=Streptomyces sp. URMC 123 TaxID=3423403 RepID=UPI003F1BD49C